MDKKVSVEVKYEAGHSYHEEFEETELFCPSCGKQSVWVNTSDWDYYVGSDYYCISCSANFNLPILRTDRQSWQTEQIVSAIKNHSGNNSLKG